MRRLENRLRRLEEHDNRVGYAAALRRLDDDEDWRVLGPYVERWAAAGGELVPQPYPTPKRPRCSRN